MSKLPADEAATLRLLASGKTPADVADALAIDTAAVKARALSGSDHLAGDAAAALAEGERIRVLDVVFGEVASDPLLDSSPAARTYANRVTEALNLKTRDEGSKSEQPTVVAPRITPTAQPERQTASVAKTKPADQTKPQPRQQPAGADRKRGLILLACAGVILVAIAVSLIAPWGGSDNKQAVGSSTSTSTTPATNNGWTIRAVFKLKSVDGSQSGAQAGLETKDGQSQIVIVGLGLPPGALVGVWLTGSGTNGLIGVQKVGKDGRFGGIGPLPSNGQNANRIIVTREAGTPGQKAPTKPGPTLLTSPFSLS